VLGDLVCSLSKEVRGMKHQALYENARSKGESINITAKAVTAKTVDIGLAGIVAFVAFGAGVFGKGVREGK